MYEVTLFEQRCRRMKERRNIAHFSKEFTSFPQQRNASLVLAWSRSSGRIYNSACQKSGNPVELFIETLSRSAFSLGDVYRIFK